MSWNSLGHVERVTSESYFATIREVFAPEVTEALGNVPAIRKDKTLHDLGGYDGSLASEVIGGPLGAAGWRAVVTDMTAPDHQANPDIPFHQVPSWDIEKELGRSSVNATVCCNVLHLLDDDELAATAAAIQSTSKPDAALVNIVPHPVTHRVSWSDFTGMGVASRTLRRGVFVDDYSDTRQAPHAFLDGHESYPRTVEGYLTPFLQIGFRLRNVRALYITRDKARPGKAERFYETLPHLPTYLAASWSIE